MKTCPFCGGNARVSHREIKYYGMNYSGEKKKKIAAQVICNRCGARGPVITETIIDPDNTGKKYVEALCSSAIRIWEHDMGATIPFCKLDNKFCNGQCVYKTSRCPCEE